jgi:hypothetical protein
MATAIALSLALGSGSAPSTSVPSSSWATTGRIVDGEHIHLGIRPAIHIESDELDLGVTIQLTLNVL